MPPTVEAFHASDLEAHLQKLPNGGVRKPPVKLRNCELNELIQYNCELEKKKGQEDKDAKVICSPVLRLFRQCANGLTVETTSWEDRYHGIDAQGTR